MTGFQKKSSDKKKPKKKAWPPSQIQLLAYARRHCARHLTNRATLCRVLQKHLYKRQSDVDPGEEDASEVDFDAICEPVIAILQEDGTLNEHKYAKAQFARMMGQGVVWSHIMPRLLAKQVPSEVADELIQTHLQDRDEDTLQLQACARYALRFGLGAARIFPGREDQAERDLGRLGRRGFSYHTARQIMEAEDMSQLQVMANYGDD